MVHQALDQTLHYISDLVSYYSPVIYPNPEVLLAVTGTLCDMLPVEGLCSDSSYALNILLLITT